MPDLRAPPVDRDRLLAGRIEVMSKWVDRLCEYGLAILAMVGVNALSDRFLPNPAIGMALALAVTALLIVARVRYGSPRSDFTSINLGSTGRR